MKDFEAKNVGKGIVMLNINEEIFRDKKIIELRPFRLVLKEDGDLNGEPSIAIFSVGEEFASLEQISLKMLNEGLAEIGYEFKKIE